MNPEITKAIEAATSAEIATILINNFATAVHTLANERLCENLTLALLSCPPAVRAKFGTPKNLAAALEFVASTATHLWLIVENEIEQEAKTQSVSAQSA